MKKINFNGEELVLPETSDLATKAEVAIIKNDLDADIQDLQDQIDGISIEGTGTSVTVDGSPQTVWESNVKVDKRLSGLFGTTIVENDGNKAGLRWENNEKDYRSFATSTLGLTYSEENSQGESALFINTASGFGYTQNNSDTTKTDRFTINSEGFNYTSEDSTTGFGAVVLVSPSALGMIGMSASGIQGVQFMDNKAQIMASSGVYINGEENSNKVATLGDLPSVNGDDKVDKQVSSHGYVATIDMLDSGGQVTISCESNDGYGALDILPTEIVSSVPIYVDGEKTVTASELPSKTSDLTNDSGFATKSELLNLVYPVGSIYISVNGINPQTLFGGTWVAWGDGRIPLAIGNNGESEYVFSERVGGSENSVASHNHDQNSHFHTEDPHYHHIATLDNGYSGNATNFYNGNAKAFGGLENNGDVVYVSHANKGGAQLIHSTTTSINGAVATNIQAGTKGGNMPPYITCYMWKRTA